MSVHIVARAVFLPRWMLASLLYSEAMSRAVLMSSAWRYTLTGIADLCIENATRLQKAVPDKCSASCI